ncbi:MAG TPA: hypothetical protein VGN12_04250 [Pirellulales bacterium]
MQRLRPVVAATPFALLLTLAGCGGSSSPAPQAAAPAATPQPPQTAAAPAAAPAAAAPAPTATSPAPGTPATPSAAAPPADGAVAPAGEAAPAAGATPTAATPPLSPQQALQAIPGVASLAIAAPRGDNLASWKPEDYRKARAERDPRLIAAVTNLGATKSSSENAAKLLVDLLRPPAGTEVASAAGAPANPVGTPAAPAAAPAGMPDIKISADGKITLPDGTTVDATDPRVRAFLDKRNQSAPAAAAPAAGAPPTDAAAPAATPAAAPTAPEVVNSEDVTVGAIIGALGANQTPTARNALKRLLLGELRTAVADPIVTGMAARAILIKPAKEEKDMLLAAAVNAVLLRPGGTADPALQVQLLAALDDRASPEVRSALADAALHKSASADQRSAVMAILMKPDPKNLMAQAHLFNSTKIDDTSRRELERRFTSYSAAAVDRLLGMNSGSLPVASSPDAATDEESHGDIAALRGVIKGIWSDDVVSSLAKSAEDAKTFADFNDGLQLGVSVPTKAMRMALGELNQAHWDEGPDEIKLGANFGDLVHDPGMLVVVKHIPRKEEPLKQKPRTRRGEANAQRTAQRGGKEKRVEKEEKSRYAWMKSTEEFVRSLNARFYTAAQSGAGHEHMINRSAKSTVGGTTISTAPTEQKPGGDSVATRAGRFPLQLHDDAHVVAEYHMCWPDDLPKRLQSLNITPLAVHYVRIEETASLFKLNTHYHAQLKGATSRARPDGRWIDWMGQGVEHGQDRTVDVIFTRQEGAEDMEEDTEETKSATRRAMEKTEPLTVEILVVEIPEYRPAPSENESENPKRKWKKGGADKEY